METKEEPTTQEPRVIWVQYQEARAVKVGGVKEGCDVDDLTKHIKEQRDIKYDEADIFLYLPEAADPKLAAYISKDTGALDPQKELGPDFFYLLGKGILKVRARLGAVPLPTQPPGLPRPPARPRAIS